MINKNIVFHCIVATIKAADQHTAMAVESAQGKNNNFVLIETFGLLTKMDSTLAFAIEISEDAKVNIWMSVGCRSDRLKTMNNCKIN